MNALASGETSPCFAPFGYSPAFKLRYTGRVMSTNDDPTPTQLPCRLSRQTVTCSGI